MRFRNTVFLAVLLLAALSPAANAQLSMAWFTVDGGGGTSTGGALALRFTVGQPDAGAAMTGGQLTLVGGFWGGVGSTLACGTSDFDGDGDAGTDADIEAFFACLAGNCCPLCYPGGADFNADGDSGTDADIESFFRVLAGGPC
jgi:hypothetical protein